jgi:hypothetical protein
LLDIMGYCNSVTSSGITGLLAHPRINGMKDWKIENLWVLIAAYCRVARKFQDLRTLIFRRLKTCGL